VILQLARRSSRVARERGAQLPRRAARVRIRPSDPEIFKYVAAGIDALVACPRHDLPESRRSPSASWRSRSRGGTPRYTDDVTDWQRPELGAEIATRRRLGLAQHGRHSHKRFELARRA